MKDLFTISLIVSGLLTPNSEIAAQKDLFIKKYKHEYTNILNHQILTQNIAHEPSLLSIPVYLYVFNNYYTYYFSEYRYLDEYEYNDKIFIFDKNTNYQSSNYKNNHWLENLRQTKNFTSETSQGYSYDGYQQKHNINWISGRSGADINLKNILSLKFPRKTSSPFSKHPKEIVLTHNHKHGKHIKEYSGYWKDGQILDPNLFFHINYGKLLPEDEVMPWFDIYTYTNDEAKITPTCDQIRKFGNREIGQQNNFNIKEGFNSTCKQLSLEDHRFKFHQKNWQYSTGYAAYKNIDTHWQTQNIYYYLLGGLFDTPYQTYNVNRDKSTETLWYVDYDDVFVIDIDNLSHTEKSVEFSIKINPTNMRNKSEFLTVSSGLKFQLSFYIDGEYKNVEFTLKDVFDEKKYKFNFPHVKNEILFQNPVIKLIKNNDLVFVDNEKEYRVSNLFDNNNSIVFNELLFKLPEQNDLFYSEIKNKKRWHDFFYIRNNQTEIKLDSSFLDWLNVRVSGSDTKKYMKLTYFDFFEKKDKITWINNLKTLPHIESGNLTKEKYQFSATINRGQVVANDYFWHNIHLVLKEKNIFEGVERYSILPKIQDTETRNEWKKFYQGRNLFLHTMPVIKTKMTVDENNLSNNFYITEYGKKQGFMMEDFDFSLIDNKENHLTILAKWNKFGVGSYKTIYIKKNQDFINPLSTFSKPQYPSKPHEESLKPTPERFKTLNQNSPKSQNNLATPEIPTPSTTNQLYYPAVVASISLGSTTIAALGLNAMSFMKKTT